MHFVKVLLVSAWVSVGWAALAKRVLKPDEDSEVGEGPLPELPRPPPEELSRLRFDGTLKTVADYMATAHAKYLETMLSIGSSERGDKNPSANARASEDTSNSPGSLADSRQKKDCAVPKDPCLDDIPDFLCTVQLVPGGMRYIVSRKEVEDDLQEADENYQGFALPFCCGGRASWMVLD